MKTDFLQEEKIVTDSTGNTLENYSIEDISGEDVNVPDGEFFALVDENEKKIYVGLQVKYYSLMIEKIRQINSALTNNVDAKKVNETDIENVAERMACFKDAFDDIHPGIPIESVARYRMINHIMLLNTSKADITDWLALIKNTRLKTSLS